MLDPNNPLTPRLNEVEQKSLKNYFINGDFEFWQRGFSTTASSVYLADRWVNGNGTTSYTRETGGANGSDFFARVSGSSSTVLINQRVESIFTKDIKEDKMTISIYAKINSGSSDLSFRLFTPNTIDNYGVITEVFDVVVGTLTSTWQRYEHTFDVTPTMKTNGFQINIGNFNASSAIELDFSRAMLNEGDEAVEFQRAGRNYAEEERLCQRYYETVRVLYTNYQITGPTWYHQVPFIVEKRNQPTITYSNISGSEISTNTSSFADVNSPTRHNFNMTSVMTGTATIRYDRTANIDAEL